MTVVHAEEASFRAYSTPRERRTIRREYNVGTSIAGLTILVNLATDLPIQAKLFGLGAGLIVWMDAKRREHRIERRQQDNGLS